MIQLAVFQPAGQRDAHPVTAELREVIVTADRLAPRSLQLALGPSEIGEPCARRLAYRLMDESRTNRDRDPWASIVGTSVHAWLAEAFTEANRRAGRIRYLIEQCVEVRPGLGGSCDLYDADRAMVIDHKVVGPTNLRHYRVNGPSVQYRVQAHAYGLGLSRLGLPVRDVALAFYPRSSDLSDLHVWSEPFDPDIVNDALQRHDTILCLVHDLDVEHHIDRYRTIPTTPGHSCIYCPWFRAGPDTGAGCPGDRNPDTTSTT